MNTVIEIPFLQRQFKHFTLDIKGLSVEKGTVTGLIGANGSGKSTLFFTLMNILQADNGSFKLFGKDMKNKETEIKERIGYAGGHLYDAFSHLTVSQLAGLVSHWYSNWDKKYYQSLIKKYQINPKEKYGNCSTGTKKKVEFVFALAHKPELLLLDEPTANVDMLSQQMMREDLLDYMEKETNTIFMSTHNQEEVKRLCDYICFIENGQIKGIYEKDDLQNRWAVLWISHLPEILKNDPRVSLIGTEPLQILTNRLPELQEALISQQAEITHVKRLEIAEIMKYTLAEEKTLQS